MLDGFKKFALRGNVFDLAIGVMIGGAFGKIVSSLVSDIITPLISVVTKNVNLTNLYLVIGNKQDYTTAVQAKEAGAVVLNYGTFLQNVMDFLIISITIYIVVTQIERVRRKFTPVKTVTDLKECPYCFTQINVKATRCPHCTSKLTTDEHGGNK